MFNTFILPVVIFAIIGIIAGILLTVASKLFEVKTDQRIELISDVLPQANCGACGFAGCSDYADAIVSSGAASNLCRPGGASTSEKIAAIMGTKADAFTAQAAVLHCGGNCRVTTKKFDFIGISSCSAAKRFYGGNGLCTFGCIGLGDCVSVCDTNCISICNGIAEINKYNCIACGKCVNVCPNSLITLRPVTCHIDVACSSKDNGKITKQNCSVGCIGCKICEKKCLNDAIHIIDFHAVIDYSKCTSCGACFDACPTGAITNCECNIQNL